MTSSIVLFKNGLLSDMIRIFVFVHVSADCADDSSFNGNHFCQERFGFKPSLLRTVS